MSGAGTAAKPRVLFCWACGRQLRGRHHRIVASSGVALVVHVACVGYAAEAGFEIVPGAHLAPKAAP